MKILPTTIEFTQREISVLCHALATTLAHGADTEIIPMDAGALADAKLMYRALITS